MLARIERGAARLVTRNGLDWTDRFPDLAAALAALPARNALLDGEVVVFDREGRTSFQALQGALGRKRSAVAVHFAAFDCLYLDGRDVRAAPLLERKQLLRALLARVQPRRLARCASATTSSAAGRSSTRRPASAASRASSRSAPTRRTGPGARARGSRCGARSARSS